MATWNTTIPAHDTTLFTDVEWVAHLCNAVNQRVAAWLASPPAGGETTSPAFGVAAGDDVQSYAFWHSVQENLSIILRISAWVRQDNPVDPVGGFQLWDEASLRTYLGLANGDFRTTPPADPPPLWRRVAPREVRDMTQTQDTAGNTLGDGMVARLLDDSRIYTLNSGVWAPAPSATADLLDSDNPASGDAHVDPGVMLYGDYIGPWILSEMRAVINALVWVEDSYPPITSGTGTVQAGQGDSQAAASADYPDVGAPGFPFPAGGDVLGSAATVIDQGPGAGPSTAYQAQTTSNTVTTQSGTDVAIEADIYVRPEIDNVAAFDSLSFDGQGISWLVQNQWAKWTTVGPSAAPMVSPPWSSDLPPNWPTPVAGQRVASGYTIQQNATVYTDVIAVLRYDVSGGFDEQASSA